MDFANEFPLDPALTYLNHAAVSPWPLRVANAVRAFADENLHLGSKNYLQWLHTESELRQLAGTLINASHRDDIALLKNTSEALSVVAYGLDWQPGDNVVISNQEFPSNRIVWESLATKGVLVRAADLGTATTPEQAIIEQVDENTRLIAISSVQFASGLRMNLDVLGQFCRRHAILFCVDAIQSLGAHSIDVQAANIDYLMADAHKWLLGPEGIAVFYSRPEARDRLSLSQYGWHMVEHVGDFDRQTWQMARSARRFECGSPNALGIHALHASLSLLHEVGMARVEKLVSENTGYLINALSEMEHITLITPTDPARRAGIVTFRHMAADQQALFQYLQQNGVMCAQRGGGIRFSPHFYTSGQILDRALALVAAYQAD